MLTVKEHLLPAEGLIAGMSLPKLDPDAPQVWTCILNESAILAAASDSRGLSEEEQDRYRRFLQPLPRAVFAHSRRALRTLLGHFLGQPADALRFSFNENGKPSLEGATTRSPIEFNLSHSDRTYCLAFHARGRIGVDLEGDRPLTQLHRIAERFFTPEERDALAGLSDPQLTSVFFRIWTAKEALIKALGLGVFGHLGEAMLAVGPGGKLGFKTPQWALHPLGLPPGMVGHVAVEKTK